MDHLELQIHHKQVLHTMKLKWEILGIHGEAELVFFFSLFSFLFHDELAASGQ